uniref:Uncharacterized protein n=1 Tax=Aplanochytrium stocchinoi TaxID=215587 RepID=A0A6S8AS38_9STRA|mmetsp:Transcript_6006/g.7868  ORF Transcript_6006/g.7868 Transcript_6006/m.7868 type:complete len:233 (-) Transcript_6006:1285-1983(-)
MMYTGYKFRSRLSPSDVAQIRKARDYFHLTSLIPLILYYLKTSEERTKFPATISFTIRKGIPRAAHHVLWLLGWYSMYDVFHRAGSRFSRLFAIQMWVTGVICTFICQLGQGKLSDAIHFVTATMYMIDHVVLFSYLKTRRIFRSAFYVSFLAMAAAMREKKRIHREHDLFSGEYSLDDIDVNNGHSIAKEHEKLSRLEPVIRNKIWWMDVFIMTFENLLFTSFVSGMTSGL